MWTVLVLPKLKIFEDGVKIGVVQMIRKMSFFRVRPIGAISDEQV